MGALKTRSVVVRFGLFSALSIAMTAFIGFEIARVSFDDRYELTATFDDVSGLFPGDDGKLAGVAVGSVGSIDVQGGRAVVALEVADDVALPPDTEVAIRWRNLIGQRYVELRPGDAAGRLADGDEIERTRSVVDIGLLVNRLGPLARAVDPGQLNRLLTALAEALEGRGGDIGGLMRDVDAVLATLAERDDTIAQLVTDYATVTETLARRDDQIRQVVDDLVLLTQAFADNTTLLDTALVELGGFSEGLAAVLGEDARGLGATIDDLAVVTGTARDHIAELEEALNQLPPAVRDLFDASDEGEFVTVYVACLEAGPPPCPYTMVGPQ